MWTARRKFIPENRGEILEFLSESRVGDVDKRFGAFPQCFTVQVGNSMFRDDVVHVSARCHNTSSRLENRDNPRYLSSACN